MVKVISLSNEAYEKLKAIKRDKSFSEVVVELVDTDKENRKQNLMKFAGVFAKDADKWEKIKQDIYRDRENFKLRDFNF
jgi:predicted CopG family antitoxin|tara:strand:- start:968 stop:1204 length:237 start_codon:yes stop_codon:yes gene_type:complete